MSTAPNPPTNSRAVAAQIVTRWLTTEDFPSRLLEPITADRPFIMEVVYGVARWRRALEWVVRRYAEREPDPAIMGCLLVGLYQVLFMDRVAPYAAVNETVQAAKASLPGSCSTDARKRIAGFVNGLLRRAVQQAAILKEELSHQDLATRESHPDMLVTRWLRCFGDRRTLKLCQWDNQRSQVHVRPNRRKTTVPAYMQLLKANGIKAVAHPFAPTECVTILGPYPAGPSQETEAGPGVGRITELPGYASGLFSVQDPATLLSVRMLNPQPSELVLDACAAPGGKTILIAEKMHGDGQLVALELHRDRFERLLQTVERMRLSVVTPVIGDARRVVDLRRVSGGHLFDRILLDVPCSNTGVLQRRPDARWRFSPVRLARLVRVQVALLDAAAQVLRPGGTIVYSTCSLEYEECEGLVRAWLKTHPRFRLAEQQMLFPPETHTDGAYAAALVSEEVG